MLYFTHAYVYIYNFYSFANMMSSVYIVDDQCCERIRTALELTDIDKDIHTFVKNNATCQSIPSKFLFPCYFLFLFLRKKKKL